MIGESQQLILFVDYDGPIIEIREGLEPGLGGDSDWEMA